MDGLLSPSHMSENSYLKSVDYPKRDGVKRWFEKPLGAYLLEREQYIMSRILPNLFGFHILQIGSIGTDDLLGSSRISHQIVMNLEDELPSGDACLQCSTECLSIASDSIDVVVLPHVLEFCANPHKMLREIERILIGEGHLVIIGFNPLSFCGLWRLFLAWRDDPPWNGLFFSFARIKDWFSLLDFEIIRIERFFYKPPLINMTIMGKLHFLEKLGNYCCSYFGGIHIIVAKKRVVPLTPISLTWHKRRKMIASGIAEPTTRLFSQSQ